jgi:hypothetical protein
MNYVTPEQIDVKVCGRFTWKELVAACKEMPVGRGLMVDVPKGMTCAALANLIRSNLAQPSDLNGMRFSVRQAKNEKSVFVLKAEEVEPLYKQLQREGIWKS